MRTSPYDGYPHVEALPVKDKVLAIKETAINLLQEGFPVSRMKALEVAYVEEEQYEAAQAVVEAVREFSEGLTPLEGGGPEWNTGKITE